MSTRYISRIEVKYGSSEADKPSDDVRVLEYSGQSDNINYGCGGQHVWLVPDLTTSHDRGLAKFQITIQKEADATQDSLSKGAPGDYRYLVPVKSLAEADLRVIDVKLYRRDKPIESLPAGWHGHTDDINEGRDAEGSYLYLLWKLE